jgi:hypothetical protein
VNFPMNTCFCLLTEQFLIFFVSLVLFFCMGFLLFYKSWFWTKDFFQSLDLQYFSSLCVFSWTLNFSKLQKFIPQTLQPKIFSQPISWALADTLSKDFKHSLDSLDVSC